MVINNGNIHEVNNISLHDACFESFVFDRVHNRLETVVKPEWPFVVPPDFDSSESFEHAELKRIRITCVDVIGTDRKSTRLNSSHSGQSRMPSSA